MTPSAGALRAANRVKLLIREAVANLPIKANSYEYLPLGEIVAVDNVRLDSLAEIIDRESGLSECLEALERILSELPTRRDWLDPELERTAREAISKARKP